MEMQLQSPPWTWIALNNITCQLNLRSWSLLTHLPLSKHLCKLKLQSGVTVNSRYTNQEPQSVVAKDLLNKLFKSIYFFKAVLKTTKQEWCLSAASPRCHSASPRCWRFLQAWLIQGLQIRAADCCISSPRLRGSWATKSVIVSFTSSSIIIVSHGICKAEWVTFVAQCGNGT